MLADRIMNPEETEMVSSGGLPMSKLDRDGSEGSPVRVVVQQPALPKYRIPVFAALAKRPKIRLKVIYGSLPEIKNVAPAGFDAEYHPLHIAHLANEPIYWHSPQWIWASRRNTDVLILSWDMHYLSLIPALLRARTLGVPTVLWGHAISKSGSFLKTGIRDYASLIATAVLTYSETAKRRLVDAGWPSSRIFVAPNSIDQASIRSARLSWLDQPQRLERFKVERGLDRGPVVLFVSRLHEENRLELLLLAAPTLVSRFPTMKICIIGDGEPESTRLKSLAKDLGISDHVMFPGPIYDEMQIAPWFLSSDVFCYPSNIGLSIHHAFGYGLPVVTSDNLSKHNPEIEAFRNGVNGLFYTDGDHDSLAENLSHILADPRLRVRMSTASLETATNEYSIPRMLDGFEAAIQYSFERSAKPKRY
jgi:glycosyltransferase involved in cell wall biosynthesis